jgi:hypothetical protein
MKRAWIWVVVVVNLIGLLVLVFVYPGAMVSPGALVAAHDDLAGNCFSCHSPFRGAASERCVSCHILTNIGVLATNGAPLAQRTETAIHVPFHQELTEQKCGSCHSEHGRLTPRRFSHDLLRAAVRGNCVTCHDAPADAFHRQIGANCTQCHSAERWKPSTFKHDLLFLLDRDHNASCETCHTNNDFKRYTCFGCHEHTLEKIRTKHEKEGIPNFENCVSCHRSAEGEAGEAGEHGEGRKRGNEH